MILKLLNNQKCSSLFCEGVPSESIIRWARFIAWLFLGWLIPSSFSSLVFQTFFLVLRNSNKWYPSLYFPGFVNTLRSLLLALTGNKQHHHAYWQWCYYLRQRKSRRHCHLSQWQWGIRFVPKPGSNQRCQRHEAAGKEAGVESKAWNYFFHFLAMLLLTHSLSEISNSSRCLAFPARSWAPGRLL